jgi:hypothetical protein
MRQLPPWFSDDEWALGPEAAKGLAVRPRKLGELANQPDGIPHVKWGKFRIYHKATVLEWLKARMQHPNPRNSA